MVTQSNLSYLYIEVYIYNLIQYMYLHPFHKTSVLLQFFHSEYVSFHAHARAFQCDGSTTFFQHQIRYCDRCGKFLPTKHKNNGTDCLSPYSVRRGLVVREKI